MHCYMQMLEMSVLTPIDMNHQDCDRQSWIQ